VEPLWIQERPGRVTGVTELWDLRMDLYNHLQMRYVIAFLNRIHLTYLTKSKKSKLQMLWEKSDPPTVNQSIEKEIPQISTVSCPSTSLGRRQGNLRRQGSCQPAKRGTKSPPRFRPKPGKPGGKLGGKPGGKPGLGWMSCGYRNKDLKPPFMKHHISMGSWNILKYWGIRGNPAGKVGSCGMPSSNETQDLASLAHLFHLLAPLVGVL
jgi:hypothetical protein